jgi:hypothetical protein
MSSNKSNPFRNRFQLRSLFRFNAIWILLILYCITVSGCEIDPLIDRSLLTGQPCEPPCWYGIMVGESDEDDVISVLSELQFVNQQTISKSVDNDILYWFSCSHPDDENCGDIILVNGKVDRIIVSVHFRLTFEQVVEKLGVPDRVRYYPYHPDTGGCMVYLDWLEQGIAIQNLETRSDKLCRRLKEGKQIEPGIQVVTIEYTTEINLRERLCEQHTCVEWPGFSE